MSTNERSSSLLMINATAEASGPGAASGPSHRNARPPALAGLLAFVIRLFRTREKYDINPTSARWKALAPSDGRRLPRGLDGRFVTPWGAECPGCTGLNRCAGSKGGHRHGTR
jgi:hypothetical protein